MGKLSSASSSLRKLKKSPLSPFLKPSSPSPSPSSSPSQSRRSQSLPPQASEQRFASAKCNVRSSKNTQFGKRISSPSTTSLPQLPATSVPVNIFETSNLDDAKKSFDELLSKFPDSSRLDHNSILHSFCNAGGDTPTTHRDAVAFLRHISLRSTPFSPDRSSYHILLVHACCQPGLSAAHQVLDLMSRADFSPTQASVDIVVRSLCAADREDDACEIVKLLAVNHNSPPDQYTYNFLIKCFCKVRSLDTVYGYIQELETDAGIEPNIMTYTILIDSVCRKKNLREASRLLTVLKDRGFKPDCYLYNTILKGYCAMNHCNDIMNVYNEMRSEGIEPDLVTYNTLVFGLAKCRRIDQAMKFLKIMTESGHSPDTVTYTSLMNGMCRNGDALCALELLEVMEENGCEPNECTYSTLVMGLCKGKHLEKGMELLKMMTSAGIKLETSAYATLVRTLVREEKIAEAYGVFDYAIESKSLPDALAFVHLETSLKWWEKWKK